MGERQRDRDIETNRDGGNGACKKVQESQPDNVVLSPNWVQNKTSIQTCTKSSSTGCGCTFAFRVQGNNDVIAHDFNMHSCCWQSKQVKLHSQPRSGSVSALSWTKHG